MFKIKKKIPYRIIIIPRYRQKKKKNGLIILTLKMISIVAIVTLVHVIPVRNVKSNILSEIRLKLF